jgi:hypothetical protein
MHIFIIHHHFAYDTQLTTEQEGLAIWKEGAEVMLRNLDPSLSLPQQLEDLILPLCNDSPSPSSKLHVATPGDKSEDNTESMVDQLLKVIVNTVNRKRGHVRFCLRYPILKGHRRYHQTVRAYIFVRDVAGKRIDWEIR